MSKLYEGSKIFESEAHKYKKKLKKNYEKVIAISK